jgi:tRNA-2-methylthio-N6-dimethylallyladenosine synthase
MRKHVYVETYGCQMNVADTELILGQLDRDGYVPTDDPSAADVLLVNTCAIRDNAEQRVIGRLGELKRHKRPGVVLGVVGCMAQRLGTTLLDEAPHVDLVVGPDGYRGLPELIGSAQTGARVADIAFKSWEHYEDVPQRRPGRQVSAFVTVQRGCDYRCTFCVVPMTRGRERSRKLADVVSEVEGLAGVGVTEVTLLGQTVNSYHDGTHDFADLLRAVGVVDGVRRVRFTSPYPNDFTDRAIAAMADVDTVCEHVHLPVQSGSSQVLKRMGRRYDRAQYLDCVARLRAAVPDLAVTTDIIVGFPGEDERHFLETLSLVREVGFDDAFTFKYSPRDGTGALRLPGHVPDREAGERLERLIAVVRDGARRQNLALVGTTHEVLVEKVAKRGGMLQARTRTNKVVLVDGPPDWMGSYRIVRLSGTTGATFTGVQANIGSGLAVLG